MTPIVEEAEKNSRSSYASSNVMPIGAPDYYLGDLSSDEDLHNEHDDDRGSDHDDSSGLVRQASLGKKAKPAIIPIRRDSMPKPDMSKGGFVAQAVTSAGAAGGAFAAGLGSSNASTQETAPQSSNLSRTMLADPSDSDTSASYYDEKAQDKKKAAAGFRRENLTSMEILGNPMPPPLHIKPPLPRSGSPFTPKTSSPLSPNVSWLKNGGMKSPKSPKTPKTPKTPKSPKNVKLAAIVAGKENGGGAVDRDLANGLKSPRAGYGEKVGLKRPPRINVDAIKEAEARSSLTSLPDLIRRATRLASNLDRGKTASRMGMEWFTAEANAHPEVVADYRKSGSLSDILASFPPPGLATPTGERAGSRNTNWPDYSPKQRSKRARGAMDSRFVFDKPGKPKERRCCGMPLWAFFLLVTVLFALVVAAIVIPITLVVIPRQRDANKGGNAAISACQSKLPCQNGGSSTLAADGSCSCLCTNGFTGSTCTKASDSGCTTMAVAGTSSATVGSAIPRLLDAAQSNYSIPLDSAKLLTQFSAGNANCNTENALVTLNGQQSRRKARRSLNNMYMPLPAASNPFISSDIVIEPVATAVGPDQVKYIDAELAGWDDGQATHMPRPTYAASLVLRAASTDDSFLSSVVSSNGGGTVNGILVATGSPSESGSAGPSTATASNAILTASGSPTLTASSARSSATGASGSSQSGTSSQAEQDFARIAVLFVLQETGSLSDASDAQSRLSSWFAQSSNHQSADKNIGLGTSGWTIDLTDFIVTVQNGTTYGHKTT